MTVPESEKSSADLAIVIVNYNTTDLLLDCLRSIYSTIPPALVLEAVVVDNSSFVDDLDRIVERFPDVRILRTPRNLGFSQANNLGVRETTAPLVLFLNPDTVMHPGTLETMIGFMADCPDAGAASCYVALAGGELDDASHRGFPTPWNSFTFFSGLARLAPRSRIFAGYWQGWAIGPDTHQVDAVAGAFMLVRRSAGEQLRWWDEDFFFYGEDLDFCFRLKQSGWAVYFVPEVRITHLKGMSSGIKSQTRDLSGASLDTRRTATRARFEAMRIFYRKHYAGVYPRPVGWAVFFAITLKEFHALSKIGRRRLSSP